MRHFFAGVAARRENQHGRQIRAQRLADHARPETFRLDELRFRQDSQVDFLERDGPLVVRNQNGVAADALKPRDDILRISDAAAEQKSCVSGGASARASS